MHVDAELVWRIQSNAQYYGACPWLPCMTSRSASRLVGTSNYCIRCNQLGPIVRPLSRTELQSFFNYADDHVHQTRMPKACPCDVFKCLDMAEVGGTTGRGKGRG